MPAIRAPGRQSRNVTDRPNLPITHRYIYFAGTLRTRRSRKMGGRQGGLGTALMSEPVVMLKEGIR
jgi:hypothetical protein